MHDYRYYTLPIIGNAGTSAVVELDMFSVNMDRELGTGGNLSGHLRLGTGIPAARDSVLVSGTAPGFYQLVCERDQVPIWAGPIWSQTYESKGQTLQITAQTWESIWDRTKVAADKAYAAQTVTTIVNDLLSQINSQYGGDNNYGITWSAPTFPFGEPTATIRHFANEHITAGTWFDELFNLVRLIPVINIGQGTGDLVTKTMTAYAPELSTLVTPGSTGLTLEFPGQLSGYWWPANASQGGIRHVAVGDAQSFFSEADSNMAVQPSGFPAVAVGGGNGWPRLISVKQWNGIRDTTAIGGIASLQALTDKAPIIQPTFEWTDPGRDFTGWNDIGKTIDFNIKDSRFAAGISISTYLKGWSLQPESSETPEKLILSAWSDG